MRARRTPPRPFFLHLLTDCVPSSLQAGDAAATAAAAEAQSKAQSTSGKQKFGGKNKKKKK
jgi:outer membrane lipoprotein-sorting protein